jgi:hypothetical protein
MKPTALPPNLRAWVDARRRHHLSHTHVQMARELGLNPDKLGKLDNHRQQPWKEPLPAFIERLYRERFGRDAPPIVRSIEEAHRADRAKRAARKAAKRLPAVDTATPPTPSPSPDAEALTGTLIRLAAELTELRREGKALGLFTDDRDLLLCPTCGLMEDVLASGLLVTYRGAPPQPDSGLRFTEPTSPDGPFICPACGCRITLAAS